jgi:pyruvate dehydrogenase E1 component
MAAQAVREAGRPDAASHAERLLAGVVPLFGLVAAIGGHPRRSTGWDPSVGIELRLSA